LEPATSSLLPGLFLGSSGCSQQPPAFYLDGSLVLKLGASGFQPFTWMVPWFLRLEPAATSLLEQGIQDTEWTVIPVSTLARFSALENVETWQKSIIKNMLYINASVDYLKMWNYLWGRSHSAFTFLKQKNWRNVRGLLQLFQFFPFS
jgi:hypothetical protein